MSAWHLKMGLRKAKVAHANACISRTFALHAFLFIVHIHFLRFFVTSQATLVDLA